MQSAIRAFFRQNQNGVLGATLGGFLKARFPTLDYRSQGQSLKQFLQSIMPGEVRLVRKHGLDDVLECVQEGLEQPENPAGMARTLSSDNVWEVFRNPTIPGQIFYDPATKQLSCSDKPVNVAESSPPLTIVERISHAEQRAMMAEFAQNYRAPLKTHLFKRPISYEKRVLFSFRSERDVMK